MHGTVKELLATYRTKVGKTGISAIFALSCVAMGGCALMARRGTLTFRVLAVAGLVLLFGAWLVCFRRRQKLREERSALQRVLGETSPLFERVSRAIELNVKAPTQPGVSSELAQLHYHRTLAAIDPGIVVGRAEQARRRFIAVALLCGLATLATMLALPNHILEGANVLFARGGVAPVPFAWFEYVSIEVKLPAYLGNRSTLISWESAASLPEGTTVSVRGRPLHDGRRLVLWDGYSEVPFVEDGGGQAVAHWVVAGPVELRLAARFGGVLILEPGSVQLNSEPDRLPEVALLMDSRDVVLEESQQVEVRFRVTDDHQVSQVDLVLRALGREERRTLDRPAPGNRRVDGGYVLRADDPFLEKAFVPVIAKIEARDNNPNRSVNGWGKSEAIVLRPREVGAPQAQRLSAMQSVVDALLDELAALKAALANDKVDSNQVRKATHARLQMVRKRSQEVMTFNYSGVEVPRGMDAFAEAQFEKLMAEFSTGRASETSKARALERIILSFDAAFASLARRDAQDVSKGLGDVADELAFAARTAQGGEAERPDALERLDLAVSVIQGGAGRLRQLGVLGADLGAVALGDLKRVTTARSSEDYMHAELAALHMAARLHRPKPSFGAKGGSGSVGVEGGDGGSQGEGAELQEGPASNAAEQFDRMARELEELAQEHAHGLERSASALDAAEEGLGDPSTLEEAKRRADALRRATAMLPQPGEAPSTSRASAALAREHSIAMAHELEDLDFEQAVENGQRARSAAEEALRRGDLDFETEVAARDALKEVTTQLEWATQQRADWRARKERAAKDALQEVARFEQELGERTRRLASEGQASEHGLPADAAAKLQEAEEFMRHAARQLGSGEGQQGLNLQRHAQRLLEEAQLGETKGSKSNDGSSSQSGRSAGFGGTVPQDAEGTGAQDFRRRVLEGLARSSGGRLAPAIKRYAEGLLR